MKLKTGKSLGGKLIGGSKTLETGLDAQLTTLQKKWIDGNLPDFVVGLSPKIHFKPVRITP